MKGVLLFFFLILFRPAFAINTLSSTESLTISSNRTIVSHGDVFELGFFKPDSSSRNWFLGIWYKKVAQRTYAWVANRDSPLSTPIGTLKISNMNLVILDHSNNSVWSTNLPRGNVKSPVLAELLPNGNFVMRYSNNNDPSRFLWQSFDFPTDTVLPGMKLGYDLKTGLNRVLTSWRSQDDPASGNFSYKLHTRRGLPEFLMWQDGFLKHRSGPWNGNGFSGIPEDRNLNYMVYNYTENTEEVTYTFLMTNNSIYSRLTLDYDGIFQRLTWVPPSREWSQYWTTPTDMCDLYEPCGPYSYCDTNTPAECNCIEGFDPKNRKRWDLGDRSDGCVRRTPLSCSGDGFVRLKNVKLPDTITAIVDWGIGLDKCEERCLRDCNCTSYASKDVRSGVLGCVIWSGELVDIRNYAAGGHDLYVRLNAADLG